MQLSVCTAPVGDLDVSRRPGLEANERVEGPAADKRIHTSLSGTGCKSSTKYTAGSTYRPLKDSCPLRGEIVLRSTPELMNQGNYRRNECGNQDHYPIQKSTKRFNHRSLLGDESATPWLEPSIIEAPMLSRHGRRECGHNHQPSTYFTQCKPAAPVRCMSSGKSVGKAVEYWPLYSKARLKPRA